MTLTTHPSSQTTSLAITIDARVGALDRVLGILSHQGILPLALTAQQAYTKPDASSCNNLHQTEDLTEPARHEARLMRVEVTIEAQPDTTALGKLIKLIEKQVDVVEVTVK